MMSRPLRWGIAFSLTLAVGLLIQFWLGWQALLAPWQGLSAGDVVLAVALLGISYLLRGVRFYCYFYASMRGHFGRCLRVFVLHNGWNQLLPMRLGEASFPVLMQQHFALPPLSSVAGLLWLRLLDLHSLLLIAFAVWLWFQHSVWGGLCWAVFLLLPWLGFVLLRRLSTLYGAAPAPAGLLRHLGTLSKGMPHDWQQFVVSWGWTLLNWGVKLAVLSWLLRCFVALDVLPSVMAVGGAELTSVLPVHGLAGLGTYEAGMTGAALLPASQVSLKALSAAALSVHMILLGSALLAMLPAVLYRPVAGEME